MSDAMESTWERRNQIYPVNKALAQQLFDPFIPQKNITAITYLSGGLRNTNYKISVDGYKTPFVLRIYADEDESCKKELAIYKLLKGVVPLPQIYYTTTTKDIIDRSFSILGYLEGTTLANMIKSGWQPGEEIASEIGGLLGTIHSHRFEKTGFLDENLRVSEELGPIHEWMEKYVLQPVGTDKVQQKLPPGLAERLKIFVRQEQTVLSDKPPLVLSHGDFKPTNILISGHKITGILDWEFAFAGPYYFDLGQILRYDEDLPHNFENHLMAGYRQNIDYNIPEYWKRMARSIDLINLIGFLEDCQNRPEMQKQVVRLISKTIDFDG
ncbi:aminoglycoside phosphotransferase family protein [Fulvivirgaceae bacterium BMA12]|uniref:Aminoglycoside phosphotransferase family protein n=1 Tax=Agaribacillus aureus TaxID=3051825 RepID=A0ABT8L7P0_9BACT|nr:aminoglycoside phosphotransferase family protein [Fulvivirgaceae bacterium BMA12]